MSQLRATITRLAEEFTAEVLKALQGASLSELASIDAAHVRGASAHPKSVPARSVVAAAQPRARRVRRGGRRSAKDLQGTVDAIVSTLRGSANGMRSEQLQKALGLSRKDIARPLQLALESKALRKRGERRATTYFAA